VTRRSGSERLADVEAEPLADTEALDLMDARSRMPRQAPSIRAVACSPTAVDVVDVDMVKP
jgi:hypothetical protein